MIKAVFWDNDGVLVDTEKLYFQANQETLHQAGIEFSLAQFQELSLKQGLSVLRLAEKHGRNSSEIDQLREERDQRYAELLKVQTEIRPGVLDCLNFLKGKTFLGIVTAAQETHFNIIHQNTNLLPYFNLILTRKDFHHSKPHPEAYLVALKKSGFKKEECLAIEDTERGVLSATNAGIKCLAVPNEITKSGNFEKAHQVYGSFEELKTYFSTKTQFSY